MKVLKPILIFYAVFSLLFLVAILFVLKTPSEENKGMTVEEQTERQEKATVDNSTEKIRTVEETVNAFVAVIYDYDTSERAFYEGAEDYMTEAAYEKLVPFQASEEPQEPIHMVSILDEARHYYHNISDEQVEVLSEIWYRVSGSGEFRIRQILKLRLIFDECWLIQECNILDTLEE